MRSGYAFAHSEGFGRLITSGRIMKEVKTNLFEFAFKKLSQVGGLGGGRGKGSNGSHQGSSQVSGGRSNGKSNGTGGRGGILGRSASELTVPPGQVEEF